MNKISNKLSCSHIIKEATRTTANINPPMANGGGGMDATPPKQVFPTFLGNGKNFLQTKFLAVSSSLGYLSRKKFLRSDQPSWL